MLGGIFAKVTEIESGSLTWIVVVKEVRGADILFPTYTASCPM
jgi:hypothetical protein